MVAVYAKIALSIPHNSLASFQVIVSEALLLMTHFLSELIAIPSFIP